MSLVYVDTGVLMKRHVRTPTSDAIDDLLGNEAHRLLMARQLIAEGKPPLDTLDAIHLATALKAEAEALATDDPQLARAAKAQSLGVISFP